MKKCCLPAFNWSLVKHVLIKTFSIVTVSDILVIITGMVCWTGY